MCPKNASYYGNRAATLMMLCRYREALEDSQKAVRLDDDFMKVGYIILKEKWLSLQKAIIFKCHFCFAYIHSYSASLLISC